MKKDFDNFSEYQSKDLYAFFNQSQREIDELLVLFDIKVPENYTYEKKINILQNKVFKWRYTWYLFGIKLNVKMNRKLKLEGNSLNKGVAFLFEKENKDGCRAVFHTPQTLDVV